MIDLKKYMNQNDKPSMEDGFYVGFFNVKDGEKSEQFILNHDDFNDFLLQYFLEVSVKMQEIS